MTLGMGDSVIKGSCWRCAELTEERDRAKEAGIAVTGKLLEAIEVGQRLAEHYDTVKAERDAAIRERWQVTAIAFREIGKRETALKAAERRVRELEKVLGDWPADAHSGMCAFLNALQTGKAVYPECNCGFEAREALLLAEAQEGKP